MTLIESNWKELFDAAKREDLAELYDVSLNGGLNSSEWDFYATPIFIPPRVAQDLGEKLKILEKLIFDLPERLFEGDWKAFYNSLQLDPPIIEALLKYGQKKVMFPLRWDLIPTENQWKIIELNAGYCLGGIGNFHLNEAYSKLAHKYGFKLHNEAIPNCFQAIINNIKMRLSLTDKEAIAILEVPEVYHKYKFYIDALEKGLNSVSSWQFLSGPTTDLEMKLGSLHFRNQPIQAIVPMFTIEELIQNQQQNFSLIQALTEKRVTNILNFDEFAFSNKLVFSILWNEKNMQNFTELEVATIKDLIPKTFQVNDKNLPLFYEGEWVLKPSDNYGGVGVVCRWEVSQTEWENLLKEISSSKTYVIQERAKSISIPSGIIKNNYETVFGEAKPVVGLITLDGKIVGGLSRTVINVENPGVVNAHRGAASGVITLERESL
jgi:hypothetical protein